jgi:hypothetical protein
MNSKHKGIGSIYLSVAEFVKLLIPVLKSGYFYLGLMSVLAGIGLNYASQAYLHNYMSEGKTLPMLSDLILDNLPAYDLSLVYDTFILISIFLFLVYLVRKKDLNRIPKILLLIGFFYIVRGVFIVLTPFGNPPSFNGSDPLFHGFANYELGVYPSGHAGLLFLLLLLVKDRVYKLFISFCLIVVIITLFISHSHYSIDIISGIFFAYAIRAYGESHFPKFDLGNNR